MLICCLKESRNSFARKCAEDLVLLFFKKTKVNHYVCKKNNIFLSMNNKSLMLQVFTMRGKTKVSYYITFFQTLLRTFSCGLCYCDGRIVLSYYEKRKGNYFVCKKNNIFLSTNNKSDMLQIFTL